MVSKRKSGFLATFRAETRNRSIGSKLLLLFSLAGYVFEIGPGNEWIVSLAGKNTLDIVRAESNFVFSALAVGCVLALTSLTEHLILGLAMHHNIKKYPKTVGILRDSKLSNSKILRNSQQRNLIEKFGNAFSVGAATVNLEDSVTDKEFIRKNKGLVRTVQSALLVATGSFIVGLVAGGGVQLAIDNNNYQAADFILRWIANPLVWAGFFIIVRVNDYLAQRYRNNDQN